MIGSKIRTVVTKNGTVAYPLSDKLDGGYILAVIPHGFTTKAGNRGQVVRIRVSNISKV